MASINATVQVPRLKMTRVHIPFTFRLLETGNNSYEGNVRVIYRECAIAILLNESFFVFGWLVPTE